MKNFDLNRSSLKVESSSFISRHRNILFSIIFLVINTVWVLLVFNTNYFITTDHLMFSTILILIAIGICFVAFFITLKFLDSLTIKKLFLIFVITRIVLFLYFTLMNYSVEMDLEYLWKDMVDHIFQGDLFSEYSEAVLGDWWRFLPPMLMWWYCYNNWIYFLHPIIWRLVNILIEIGIVYLLIVIFNNFIFKENKTNKNNFKIGLAFYTFSIFSIISISLYATFVAFPILLGLLGIYYYLKSKTDPRSIYYSVFFFTLCALTAYFAAIWILGLFIVLLFRKKIKKLIFLIGEVIILFCIVSAPLIINAILINDISGYFERLLWVFQAGGTGALNATVWTLENQFLRILPAVYAVVLAVYYVYKNYEKDISIDFFIVILSIFLIFSPLLSPWFFLWILPLITINLIYSYRKYLIANLLLIGSIFIFFAVIAIAFLVFPDILETDVNQAFAQINTFIENDVVLSFILHKVGLVLFQIGLIYIVYSYTKSNQLLIALLLPFMLYFSIYLPFFQ